MSADAFDEDTEIIEITGTLEETILSEEESDDTCSSGQFEDIENDDEDHDDDESDDTYSLTDPSDCTWEPSMQDIQLEDDSLVMDDQPEDYPEDMVFDVEIDQSDGFESDHGDDGVNDVIPTHSKSRNDYIRQTDPEDAASSDKAIAYKCCLLQLAELNPPNKCQIKDCTAKIQIASLRRGTAIFLVWKCSDGHIARTWCSQPKLPHGVLAGDFSLAACILLSGNNYKKVALMMKFMELGCVNSSSFYRIQSLYCCPAINTFWEEQLGKTLEELNGKNIIVAGDGRMDSPGFSAKYCTYTSINIETQDIIDMQIIDKRHTDLKSTNMETKGFKDAMKTLEDKGLKVVEVVTDAHPSISGHMRREHPDVKHSYDMWHGAKNMSKKITAIAAYKATRDLLPWRSDIVGHFWHSCQTAAGDEAFLRNKWTEVVHHIVDEHQWALGCCDHGEIEEHSKEYLAPGSPAHLALIDFVFDDRLLRNLKYYVNYRSTAELEGFQNHILMYAGKRFAYTQVGYSAVALFFSTSSYPVYKARCQLAGLDYQLHKDRPLLMSKDGTQRWHRSFNKNSVRWRAYAMREVKPYSYVTDLLADIFRRRISDTGSIARRVELLESDPRRLVATIAPVPPPPTEQLVAEHQSRFKVNIPDV